MRRSFANMLSAHDACRRYDKLSQTSVKDCLCELVQVVRELEEHSTSFWFEDFIKGLKSNVCRFAQDHAPTGWWTDIEGMYQCTNIPGFGL